MRNRRVLVGISLILFLVALNEFLYAQPSIEELTGRIEYLEKTIGELKKSTIEKDNIISFLKEQQNSIFQNANQAINSVDSTVKGLSEVVTLVAGLLALGFPISLFIYTENLRKQFDKRFEKIEGALEGIKKAKDEAIEEIKKAGGSTVKNEVLTESGGQKAAQGGSTVRTEVRTETQGSEETKHKKQ